MTVAKGVRARAREGLPVAGVTPSLIAALIELPDGAFTATTRSGSHIVSATLDIGVGLISAQTNENIGQ